MKFGFGTLGMPNWTVTELAARARELGYDGVGLRCAPAAKNQHGPRNSVEHVSLDMSDDELKAVRRVFEDAGVEIKGIGAHTGRNGFLRVDSDKVDWDAHTAEAAVYAKVAEKLGCSTISISVERADKAPAPGLKWSWDEYLDGLARASLAAIKGTNLTAVFQNHVWSASAEQLMDLIERTGDSHLGVVFSPDHCIVMQEDVVQLAADHSATISSVAMSDRRIEKVDLGEFDGRYYYARYENCMVGDGLVPFQRLFDTLSSKGWDGYVNLKYEKSVLEPSIPIKPWRSGFAQADGVGPTPKFGWHLPEGEVALEHMIPFMNSLGYSNKLAVSR